MQQLCSPEEAARWLQARVSRTLCADSRQIGPGDGFIAWPGAATDGRRFVASALAAGASACLIEREGAQAYGFADERIATYSVLKADTGPIAAAYFGAPSRALQMVAVTGTNGKTSTAWWLAQALDRLARRCGVIGTLGIGEPGTMVANGLTTPDPVLLQQQLRRFVDEGFSACAIEASSIGLQERRLESLHIDVAVFTNFTQDHLDYHASMQDYWQAKAALFAWPGLKAAVINIDDAKGVELSAALAGKNLDLWTVSCEQPARLRASAIVHGAQGLSFDVLEGAESHSLTTGLVGQYNVSNLLGVIAAMRALGVSLAEAVGACVGLQPVPGRAEMIAAQGKPLVVIDYAHTPDALEKVLTALKPVALARGGQLRCVFGCGGDRDASKRPLMAAAAEKNADQLMLTSDNPRSENPLSILAQMLPGLSRPDVAQVVPDRAAAIAQAISQSQPQDVVLLAGKGHENYQDINGVKHSFSDRAQAQAALDLRAAADSTGAGA